MAVDRGDLRLEVVERDEGEDGMTQFGWLVSVDPPETSRIQRLGSRRTRGQGVCWQVAIAQHVAEVGGVEAERDAGDGVRHRAQAEPFSGMQRIRRSITASCVDGGEQVWEKVQSSDEMRDGQVPSRPEHFRCPRQWALGKHMPTQIGSSKTVANDPIESQAVQHGYGLRDACNVGHCPGLNV